MKFSMVSFILLNVLASSCRNQLKTNHNQANNSNSKKYAVTFRVAQFSQSATTISPKSSFKTRLLNGVVQDTSTLAKELFQYYYVVYDKAGNEIRRILRFPNAAELSYHNGPSYKLRQTVGLREINTTDPFNVITDSLAAGIYTVVVVGTSSKNGIALNYSDANYSDENPVYSLFPKAVVYAAEGLDQLPRSEDLFFAKYAVTVRNQNIVQNITLNRVVAQLEVDLQDAIPANVAYIMIGRQGEYNGYSLKHEVPVGATQFLDGTHQINDDAKNDIAKIDKGVAHYRMYRDIWNTAQPINIVVEAYDVTNKVIFSKTINKVQFYPNRKTLLKIKLFDNAAIAKFNISANQPWGSDGPTI